jgi:acyl-CoA synthetase (AMP-forming)/AMP-acid ligase II
MSALSTIVNAESYYEEGFWQTQTIWSDLEEVLSRRADRVAFELDDRSLTFGELDRAAAALADRLADLGVEKGDVVAILGRNSLEAPVAILAAIRMGAVLAPVPPMFSAAQMEALIGQCDARALIAHGGVREIEKCASIPEENHRFLALDPAALAELLKTEPIREPDPLDPDETSLLLHSSGTTSTPKGIIHTGNTLRYAQGQVCERWELNEDDTYLIVCEFGFVGSIIFGYFPALFSGARCLLLERWDPVRALEVMEERGVTYVMAMPTHSSDLLNDADGSKYDLSKMRSFGAPGLTSERRATFQQIFGHPPLADYGLSEVPGNCAHGPHEPQSKVLKTEGLPYRGTEVRIVDSAGDPVPQGEQGQVEINGPSRLIGFLGNEELTRELIAPWGGYRTGDLGYLDVDGHLVYLGRSKDTIERAGVQIVPSDVEPTVLEHVAIREVALVPLPHDRLGETVCAAIILVDGGAEPSLGEMQEFLAAKDVAKYTWPESIEVFTEFPRTPSLKPIKGKIVEQILARHPTEAEESA